MINCNENEARIEGTGITLLQELGRISAYLYKMFLAEGISDEEAKKFIRSSVNVGITMWGEENGC